MDPEAYKWLLTFHVFGVLAWTGTLGAGLHSLLVHSTTEPEGRAGLERLERRVGIAMDISATLAIVVGLILLASSTGLAHLANGGYMHIKLAAVAAFIGVHVFARFKMKRFRGGEVASFPPWIIGIAYALMFVILVAILVQPTAKG